MKFLIKLISHCQEEFQSPLCHFNQLLRRQFYISIYTLYLFLCFGAARGLSVHSPHTFCGDLNLGYVKVNLTWKGYKLCWKFFLFIISCLLTVVLLIYCQCSPLLMQCLGICVIYVCKYAKGLSSLLIFHHLSLLSSRLLFGLFFFLHPLLSLSTVFSSLSSSAQFVMIWWLQAQTGSPMLWSRWLS